MYHYIDSAVRELVPRAEWVIVGESYSGIEWHNMHGHEIPTEEEVLAKLEEIRNYEPMRLLREERNKRIATTDWKAASDLEMSQEWIDYRQALRDLPATATPILDDNYELDMESIIWPTAPTP